MKERDKKEVKMADERKVKEEVKENQEKSFLVVKEGQKEGQVVKEEGQREEEIRLVDLGKLERFLEHYNEMLKTLRSRLQKGVDYGKAFPGASVYTLLKAGAEKLVAFAGLSKEIINKEIVFRNGEPYGAVVTLRLSSSGRSVESIGFASYDEPCFRDKERNYLPFNYVISRAEKRAFIKAVTIFFGLSSVFVPEDEENNYRLEVLRKEFNVNLVKLGDYLKKTFGKSRLEDLSEDEWKRFLEILRKSKERKEKGGQNDNL